MQREELKKRIIVEKDPVEKAQLEDRLRRLDLMFGPPPKIKEEKFIEVKEVKDASSSKGKKDSRKVVGKSSGDFDI